MEDKRIIAYTENSIGTLSFKNLCRYMRDKNQKNLIVADVDRFEYLAEKINNKDENYGLNIEMAIEFSTGIRGANLFIFDLEKREIETIQNYVDNKEKSKKQMYINTINSLSFYYGINIDKEEILDYSVKKFLNKIDIARVLYKKGRAKSVNDAIIKYIDSCILYEDLECEYNEDMEFLHSLNKKVYIHYYDSNYMNLLDTTECEIIKNKTFANHHIEEI